MRRIAAILLPSLALLNALSLGVGHAASLEVRAGVAQMFWIEMEPLHTVDLWIEVREYAGGSGHTDATTTIGPYRLVAGQTYHVEYKDGRLRTCPGVTEPTTDGPFTIPSDTTAVTHVMCVQKPHDNRSLVVLAGTSDGMVELSERPATTELATPTAAEGVDTETTTPAWVAHDGIETTSPSLAEPPTAPTAPDALMSPNESTSEPVTDDDPTQGDDPTAP